MLRRWSRYLARAAAVVALALLLSITVGTTVRIDGDSMLPTLRDGERVWVARSEAWWPPGGRAIARGDIVFFASPDRSAAASRGAAPASGLGLLDRLLGGPFVVKRVVALGGEEVRIEAGRVWIDGAPLAEPYVSGPSARNLEATWIPEGSLFVLGDHRAPLASRDSRSFGPIAEGSVAGRLSTVLWPPLRREEGGAWRLNLRSL